MKIKMASLSVGSDAFLPPESKAQNAAISSSFVQKKITLPSRLTSANILKSGDLIWECSPLIVRNYFRRTEAAAVWQ
jgi:hypothetical protein